METEFGPYLDEIIKSNTAWYPRHVLTYIAINTIYSTLSGKKLGRNSKSFTKLHKELNDTLKLTFSNVLVIKALFVKHFYAERLDKVRNNRTQTSKFKR